MRKVKRLSEGKWRGMGSMVAWGTLRGMEGMRVGRGTFWCGTGDSFFQPALFYFLASSGKHYRYAGEDVWKCGVWC